MPRRGVGGRVEGQTGGRLGRLWADARRLGDQQGEPREVPRGAGPQSVPAVPVLARRPITAVVIADNAVTREGIRRVLEHQGNVAVVAEADRLDTAIAAVEVAKPDVVLLDLVLPGAGGVEAARRLRQRCPSTNVVVLSGPTDPEYVEAMLDAGVAGYLPNSARPEQVIDAVRAVVSGSVVLGTGVPSPASCDRPGARVRPEPAVTGRELDVIGLLVDGHTNQQIAERLGISRRTVEAHLQRIFDKFPARSRTGVVLYALRHGLVAGPLPAEPEPQPSPTARRSPSGHRAAPARPVPGPATRADPLQPVPASFHPSAPSNPSHRLQSVQAP